MKKDTISITNIQPVFTGTPVGTYQIHATMDNHYSGLSAGDIMIPIIFFLIIMLNGIANTKLPEEEKTES